MGVHEAIPDSSGNSVSYRMLVGRYNHEAFLVKLQPEKDCRMAEEDTIHMISTCFPTEDIRALVKMRVATGYSM